MCWLESMEEEYSLKIGSLGQGAEKRGHERGWDERPERALDAGARNGLAGYGDGEGKGLSRPPLVMCSLLALVL